MSIGLVPLSGLEARMESVRKVRAFSWKGKSPVLAEVVNWQETEEQDFNKLMASIGYVASTRRPYLVENHVKKDEYKEPASKPGRPESCPIYEARAHRGSARLFFYHAPGPVDVAVCVHTMWKTKQSKSEQAREFATARVIRNKIFDMVQTLIAELHRKGEL